MVRRWRISWRMEFAVLSCALLLPTKSALTQDQPVTTKNEFDGRTTTAGDVESLRGPIPPTAPVEFFPIPPGTVFKRHLIGDADYNVTAGTNERLIYSNTLGTYAAALRARRLIADDITTIAAPGCKLRRIEFPVLGRVDPGGVGGPFTVNFAMYSNCPGFLSCTDSSALIIPGTQGQLSFPDDAPRLISFILPGDGVAIPNNLWFGVSFNRANAGVVMGAPAQTGFSCDLFDFPGFPCNANLGGWPQQPHASFNLELFGDTACADSFVGYKNTRQSESAFNPGAGVTFADDIELGASTCDLIAYEIAVKGVGFYTFDLRERCDGGIIPGTERFFNIDAGTDVKIASFAIDPPISLPRNLFLSAKINNAAGGVIDSGQQACIGRAVDGLQVPGPAGCNPILYPPSPYPLPWIHSGFSAAITCAGQPPAGACCDMYFTDENGEAICRQVPEMNCPFPPRFSGLRPVWVQGAACTPDPFSPQPCGKAACCKPDGTCANLTLNECNAVPPLDSLRQWQLGRFCNSFGQRCPRIACLGATGECSLPRCVCPCSVSCLFPPPCSVGPACCDSCPPVGCEDADCCTEVCNADNFCCEVEWDDTCAADARSTCYIRPDNDHCVPFGSLRGARLMTTSPPGNTATTDSGFATTDLTDPGFGCYVNNPGVQGLQTVWYKFVATHSTALLQTCNSNSPANDSLLGVYAVGDPSTPQTQCNSLIPVGCSDDVAGCSSSGKNSRICLRNLVVGNWYYVQVASKIELSAGKAYRLDITATCQGPIDGTINNYCPNATPITDGTTAFALGGATMDAPAEVCIPTMINDVWYNYTATCSGTLTIETCGQSAETSPDTNLAIYEDCLCPPMAGAPIAWSSDAGGDCGLASRVMLDAVAGSCYKIRLADSAGNRPSGQIKIECIQADCPAGAVTWDDPPDGVVDARRPYDPNNPSHPEGIRIITAHLTPGAKAECLSLCELKDNGSPNSIAAVEENPPGTYTITLARPITADAKTTITYTNLHAERTVLRLVSHPGNVNADEFPTAGDLTFLVAALQGTLTLPFGLYSGDLDHSGTITAADVLEEVDLLNNLGKIVPNPIDDPGCP